MTKTLKLKGRQVRIYQDPVTRLDFEGIATIVLIEPAVSEDPQYMAMVRFEPKGDQYFRTFGEQDLLP